MTRYFSFVMANDKDICKRIDWYDDIKTPLLTSLLQCDTGIESLRERAKVLHNITLEKIYGLTGDAEMLTDEELFIKKIIDSR